MFLISNKTVVGDYINTISILIKINLLNSMDPHKHGNKEKLSRQLKKVSL